MRLPWYRLLVRGERSRFEWTVCHFVEKLRALMLLLPGSSHESDPFITKDSVRRTNWKILQRRFPISRETRGTSSNCTRHRETRRFRTR